jgi:hypothetical protein
MRLYSPAQCEQLRACTYRRAERILPFSADSTSLEANRTHPDHSLSEVSVLLCSIPDISAKIHALKFFSGTERTFNVKHRPIQDNLRGLRRKCSSQSQIYHQFVRDVLIYFSFPFNSLSTLSHSLHSILSRV